MQRVRTYLRSSLRCSSTKWQRNSRIPTHFQSSGYSFSRQSNQCTLTGLKTLKYPSNKEQRLASQYPGENLELLAAQFHKDALELTTAGQYDHNLTLSMMKIFLLAGGTANEDFRFPLQHATKQKIKQALLDIGFKEKTAAIDHMRAMELTYNNICSQAEDTYRTLYDRKEWPPARNVHDSKAPPVAFGHIAVECGTPIIRAEVLTLIQNKPRASGSPSKKPGNCNKCDKPAHWANNECPDMSSNQCFQHPQHHKDNRNKQERKP